MSETRDLTLTPDQRRVAQALKREYGFKYPFAAHIAKSALAALGNADSRTAAEGAPPPDVSDTGPGMNPIPFLQGEVKP